jgi:hypothetical protein
MEKIKTFVVVNQVYIILVVVVSLIALGYKTLVHDKKR